MLDNNYYLGIDGGGTKTAICIINKDGHIVAEGSSGPSSIDTVSLEISFQNIVNAINESKFEGKICSVFAGIGGNGSPENKRLLNDKLKGLPNLTNDVIINSDNDVINAMLGGLGHDNGIAVIIGTGSVAYGRNNGQTWRSGGYCYQEGDGGSSYDLGYKALQHLSRALDGRHEITTFTKVLMKELNIFDYDNLVQAFLTKNRTDIASLSKIVTLHQNDKYAKNIIDIATDETALMVKTVYNKLNYDNCELAIIGSLGNADTLYKEMFINKVKHISQTIEIVSPPRYSAVYGAALQAQNQL